MMRYFVRASWLVLLLALSATAAHAGDARGLKLLRPDSLAGWEYGAPPAGWIISGGQLTGSDQSTPLLSGWTVGDFELRFVWSTKSGGTWTLGLPEVPSGTGLAIQLAEGDNCGAIS